MMIEIACPHCKKLISLSTHDINRGRSLSCNHCDQTIIVTGPFLSEIFWIANNHLNAVGRH